MKIVALIVVVLALLGFRMWGANRRREQFERSTSFRQLPWQRRPGTVRLLLGLAVVVLVVAAYLSYNGVTG
ncbi:hypothetical protein BH20ACT23_BH20ACT23_24920 [soil metagenome]